MLFGVSSTLIFISTGDIMWTGTRIWKSIGVNVQYFKSKQSPNGYGLNKEWN